MRRNGVALKRAAPGRRTASIRGPTGLATCRCARACAHPSPRPHPIHPSMHACWQAIAAASDAQLDYLTHTMTTSEVPGLVRVRGCEKRHGQRRVAGRRVVGTWRVTERLGAAVLWQVHALACSLFKRAMPGASETLLHQHQQALEVGSFDQCCATVLRTVQAVAGGGRAVGAGLYIFNNTCSGRSGTHWIALHCEVGVAPEAGDGLACRGVGGGAPGTAGPSTDAAVWGGPALQRRLPFDAAASASPTLVPAPSATCSLPGLGPALAALAQEAGVAADTCNGKAEGDDSLQELLRAFAKRKRDDEAMRRRVDADTERKMDNGVQINPALRERAVRAAAAEAAAGAGPG